MQAAADVAVDDIDAAPAPAPAPAPAAAENNDVACPAQHGGELLSAAKKHAVRGGRRSIEEWCDEGCASAMMHGIVFM